MLSLHYRIPGQTIITVAPRAADFSFYSYKNFVIVHGSELPSQKVLRMRVEDHLLAMFQRALSNI